MNLHHYHPNPYQNFKHTFKNFKFKFYSRTRKRKTPPLSPQKSPARKKKKKEKKANPTPSPELAIEHLFPPDPTDKATVERKKIPKIKKAKQNKPHSKHHADRKTPVFSPMQTS